MKKSTAKKLNLTRQTVRILSARELAVSGGALPTPSTDRDTSCLSGCCGITSVLQTKV